jgi:hypothetical protein
MTEGILIQPSLQSLEFLSCEAYDQLIALIEAAKLPLLVVYEFAVLPFLHCRVN